MGLLLARRLADEEAALVLCARDQHELQEAADELRYRSSYIADKSAAWITIGKCICPLR